MASPKYIAEAKKFQRIFSSYFPQFSDFETAAFELEWIKCRVFGNPIETVRRRKARSELKKVINALRLFSTHDTPYWQGFWELRLDAAKTAEVGAYQREILDFPAPDGRNERQGSNGGSAWQVC